MNNRVIGGIRVGQLRVQAFNCSSRVTPFFSWMQDSNEDEEYFCYGSTDGEFSLNTESTDPIQVSNADTYVFEGLNGTDTDTERSAFFSEMSVASAQYSVPPPAYSVVLPRSNKIQAFSIFEALESNGYIDEKTRVVMLDLSMYNAMLRHVAVLRFTVEFPASGGAVTSLSEGVAPLTSSFLLDVDHWVISAIHITVILFYAYFFLDEVLAIARSHSRQWQYQSVWQRSNLGKTHVKSKMRPSPLHRRHGAGVRLVGIFCYIAVWMLRLVALVKRPSELPLDSDEFVPLRPYVETFRAAQLALSACVCLAWLELLLKLRVSLHVDLLVRAVVCATPQLFALIIMVSLVVMGYASACLIVFGAQSSLFQSLPEALRSLLAVLLQTGTGAGATGSSALLGFSSHSYGEVGHDAAGTSTLRTLLLACFLLFNVFVAANLFLVVVYEGYLKARREIDIDRQQLQSRQHRGRLLDENDDRIDAAPMHLDLRNEAKVYFHAVINKFISFAPRRLRVIAKRSRAAEMQSSVLPADVDQTLTSEYDGGDDNYREDSSSSPKQQRVNSKYARGSSHSSPNRGRNRSHIRGGAQEPPSDNTRLLEGMVLQLALQNEALLRAVNELKQDVQALQRNGDMGLSDRDMLRRGSLIPMPARAQRQRKPSIASSGKPLVTIPDSQNNLTL
ncbi:unnamed protein product [Phytophthora lilii]|uniref:Unnamed protein product n=1 Tax=Phytophthora lilii TaxID=2077276 RepID=A0A9W6TXH2_9STRA|nr:unnamed protein product [Phytophthora lilii]